MEKCLFCDSNCVFYDHGFNQQFVCNTCGQYYFSLTVQHIIKNRAKELSKQSKTNIAFRNIKNKMETPVRRLFWIGKGETKAFEESNPGSTDRFLEFDEFENEQAEHAEKPNLLLDIVGAKLKETFDRCEVTKKDMILSKIISDEELGQFLNILMEKGLFSPTNTYRAFGGNAGRSIGKSSVGLTLEGWELFEKRKKDKMDEISKNQQTNKNENIVSVGEKAVEDQKKPIVEETKHNPQVEEISKIRTAAIESFSNNNKFFKKPIFIQKIHPWSLFLSFCLLVCVLFLLWDVFILKKGLGIGEILTLIIFFGGTLFSFIKEAKGSS